MILIPIVLYSVIAVFLLSGLLRAGRGAAKCAAPPHVSVIVVARNESHNLVSCVKSLDAQNYPVEKKEILLVIDDSVDDTAQIAGELAESSHSIRILKNDNSHQWKSRKKAGLELGRKNAGGDILFFTDADCTPKTRWIAETIKLFEENVGLVVGFSPLQSRGSTLWDGIIKIDSLFAALFSAGGIGWGLATTCTGRNIAIRAEALEQIGGYSALPDTLSGDDDFLLAKVIGSSQWKVRYNFSNDATVPSRGPDGFRELLAQKRRHISASSSFNRPAQLLFLCYHAANYSCWALLVMLLIRGPVAAIPLVIKIALDYLLIKILADKFAVRFSLRSFLSWQFVFPLYHILAAPVAFFGQPEWDNSGRANS